LKVCPKCGYSNPDNAVFCGKCGTRLPVAPAYYPPPQPVPPAPQQPPASQYYQPPTPTAPAQPAYPSAQAEQKRCLNCGAFIPSFAKFCPRCGKPIVTVEKPTMSPLGKEVSRLIAEKEKIESRRAKLKEMYETGRTSKEVFEKLDLEYLERLERINAELLDKTYDIRIRISEIESMLADSRREIEELETKKHLGEIDAAKYEIEKRRIEEKIRVLNQEREVLRNALKKIVGEEKEKESGGTTASTTG